MSIFDKHKDGIAPDLLAEDVTAIEHSQQQFAHAMAENNLRAAFRIYQQLPDGAKQTVVTADDVHPLATYAADERQSEEALAIVEGFSKRYPQHPDVVKNYLIAARVMQTQFGEREQAQALLARLEDYYADHKDAELIARAKHQLHA